MKRVFFVYFIATMLTVNQFGQQKNDDILFTIADEGVPVSEFLYIYKKNLGDKADFSKKSLEEYLDLYIKFKLKVKKAKDMKLDTSAAFKKEMAGYREQLAKSYLVDKEISEKLIKEAYDRMQRDLKVRHILVATNRRTKEQAEEKINKIYDELKQGKSFKGLAKKYSDDRYSKHSGGDLGWVTAMLPKGFYNFENVIYNLKKGEYSKPFETKFGYHIALLEDERPARGEIEAAHILIRSKVKGKVVPNAKEKIDSIYNRLKNGESFEKLAKEYSMDTKTAKKGGYLGFFGIGKYSQKFEDKVFSLQKDGEYSEPFKTSLGWHIVKRISKPGIKSFDKIKRSLANKINKNERYDIARKALVDKIKKEAGFTENRKLLDDFAKKLDKSFLSFKWKVPEFTDGVLFTLAGKSYTMKDFINYLIENQRARLQFSKKTPVDKVLNKLYDQYVENTCINYEQQHLETKYPDFKFLMREYTEGNLLFEVMEKEVWNKASKDTIGLKNFYEQNKNKYKWGPRAIVYTYKIKTDDQKLLKKILKYMKKHSHQKLMKKYNKKEQLITYTEGKYEKGDKQLAGMKFKEGQISEPVVDKKDKSVIVKKIIKILPGTPKTLDEARGYVIADYQEYLEKKWIDQLQKEYKVKINKKVFEKLIK